MMAVCGSSSGAFAELVGSCIMAAKAGIQFLAGHAHGLKLDSRLRGNDGVRAGMMNICV